MNEHNSFLVFFTGLSGSGKSTLCNALEQLLHQKGIRTYVLDGDNIRLGINKNLGFSPEDRTENIRRIGEISNLFIDAGVVILAASWHLIKRIVKIYGRSLETITLWRFLSIHPWKSVKPGMLKGCMRKPGKGKLRT